MKQNINTALNCNNNKYFFFTNFMFNNNNLKTPHCYVYIFNIYVYYINEIWDLLVWVQINAGPQTNVGTEFT